VLILVYENNNFKFVFLMKNKFRETHSKKKTTNPNYVVS